MSATRKHMQCKMYVTVHATTGNVHRLMLFKEVMQID